MALSAEDLAAIGKLVGDAQTTQSAAMTAAFAPVLARIEKMEKVEAPDVAALVAKALEGKVDPGKKKVEGASDADKAMTARLQDMETKLAASEQATKQANEQRSTEKMLSSLRTALGAQNVSSSRIPHVVALLHSAQGRIGLNDSGETTIRFTRDSSNGSYKDHLGLKKGLEEFLGTDEGKAFLPAAKVQGSEVHNKGAPVHSGGKLNIRSAQNALLGAAFNT